MNKPGAITTCPACKKEGNWFGGKYGPFCSQRCKMIDLGKWLGGEHVISEPLHPEHLEATEPDHNGSSENAGQ